MSVPLTELYDLEDALVRARASGVLIVEYADKKVVYRSMTEIDRGLASTRDEIAARVSRRRSQSSVSTFRRGL